MTASVERKQHRRGGNAKALALPLLPSFYRALVKKRLSGLAASELKQERAKVQLKLALGQPIRTNHRPLLIAVAAVVFNGSCAEGETYMASP